LGDDAGGVDVDVEGAESVEGLRDGVADRLGIADVGADADRVVQSRGDPFRDGFAGPDDDVAAARGQVLGTARPKPEVPPTTSAVLFLNCMTVP
jgi:hypothetical protein